MITSLAGRPVTRLGLAAHPHQDPRCVPRAFRLGINYFFFYGPGHKDFIDALAPLVRRQRDQLILATGSGSRRASGLATSRRKLVRAVGSSVVDVFFAEYITANEKPRDIFGRGGVLDLLQDWKQEGFIRYVGATTHDRQIAVRLAEDPRIDVLMHRFNMAHRKAIQEVFPTALEHRKPIVAFTATRWRSLLKPQAQWTASPPTAADCYRYCLAHRAVRLVLTAPHTLRELAGNAAVLEAPAMGRRERARWEQFGDLVYGQGKDRFETRYP